KSFCSWVETLARGYLVNAIYEHHTLRRRLKSSQILLCGPYQIPSPRGDSAPAQTCYFSCRSCRCMGGFAPRMHLRGFPVQHTVAADSRAERAFTAFVVVQTNGDM